MRTLLSITAVLLIATSASAQAQDTTTTMAPATSGAPTGPDRSVPPAMTAAKPFSLPELQRFKLDNGLRVLLLESHKLPLVQVNLIVEAGRLREEPGKYGIANLTADMLDEGAADTVTTLTSLQIAEEMEFLGARFRIDTDAYTTSIRLGVPADRLEKALDLASFVLLNPVFNADELERLRKQRLTALLSAHDNATMIADILFNQKLFGEAHAYGRTNLGAESTLRSLTTDDLKTFYTTFYRPNNATIVVVGDVTRDAVATMLDTMLGTWEKQYVSEATIPMVTQVAGRKIYLVDKPGSAQSVVRIGRLGPPRLNKDYYKLQVLNMVLGGSFTSRLNQNLREDKGYTYGAYSFFGFGRLAGPFTAAASVETSVTAPSLTEFMKELRNIMDPIPPDEIARARNYMAMEFPQRFQSVAAIAAQVEDMARYQLPRDAYDTYVDNVLAVDEANLTRVSLLYFDPNNLVIVVVGNRVAIEAQLRALNFGEVEVLSVTDVLGMPPDLSAQ